MTMDVRKPIFDAVRAAKGRIDAGDVSILDAALDRIGIPSGAGASSHKTGPRGIDLIHSFESLQLAAYRDPGPTGLPITIGWGSTTDESGKPIALGAVWTKDRADARFRQDLSRFEAQVSDLLGTAPTTQNQFDALVSFAYNVGAKALGESTLLRKHRAGDYAGSRDEFGRWNKAKGRVLPGLTRRRAAEAALYAS